MSKIFIFFLLILSCGRIEAQLQNSQLSVEEMNTALQNKEKIYIQTDKPYYTSGETIWFKAFLVNAITHSPSPLSQFIYVELADKRDSIISRVKIKNDSIYGFYGHLKLNSNISTNHYELRAYTQWMLNFSESFLFRKEIFIRNTNEDILAVNLQNKRISSEEFDCQFFPESGSLLSNHIQQVAFKAIGTDGKSMNITGTVYNQNELKICDFESINNGMGKFSIQTESGMSYYAIVNTENGTQKRFNLPEPQDVGIAMKLFFNRNSEIIYQILENQVNSDSLSLIAHVRGNFLFSLPLTSPYGKINESSLPEGIITFSVISESGKIYCERLYFSRNFKIPEYKMESNKQIYGLRDSVALKFNINSFQKTPLEGDLSISVTDNLLVQRDTLADNIKSYLLFTSDLKGYIETPGIYFTDNSLMTREKSDILMMTQGWRKYHSPEFLTQGVAPEHFIEKGQYLTGKVLNLFNRPAKGIDVIALNPSDSTYFSTQTDSLGRYLIEGINIKDSTDLFIRAFSKNRLIDVEIVPDQIDFPSLSNQIFTKNEILDYRDDYFDITRQKLISEGVLDIVLGELTVQARRREAVESTYYTSLADNIITADAIDKFLGSSIQTILLSLPGVLPSGRSVSIRGMGEPLFLINGRQVEYEDITYLSTLDIQEIALIKGSGTTFLGPKAINGAIAITLKRGAINRKAPLVSMARIRPLGYQQSEEFYVPKYGVSEKESHDSPDLRTTIYWNPKLKSDSNGTFSVQFYTADSPNDYLITIEGISKEGEICRFVDVLKLKE